MESTPNTQAPKIKFNADLRPAYYDAFQCIAEKCQISCCADPWNITFNRKDYLKVRQQKGSAQLHAAIKEALVRTPSNKHELTYAAFRLTQNGCPLLTEERLCRLQAECGYDTLPEVCKSFPREKEYSASGYYEYSLSPACEAVLELLWHLPEGIDFVSDPLPKTMQSIKAISAKNISLASHFQEIRSLCISLLQDRRFSIQERILLVGLFLQKLMAEDVDIPAWLQETEAMLQLPDLTSMLSPLLAHITPQQQNLVLVQHIKTIFNLQGEATHQKLKSFIQMVLQHLVVNVQSKEDNKTVNIRIDIQKFIKSKNCFHALFSEKTYFFENLAVAVFFHQKLPNCNSAANLWKSYVNFCNIFSLFHFMAITSCLEPAETAEAAKHNLFCGILCVSRKILHSAGRQKLATQAFFHHQNNSLSHMAMLLSI